MSTRAAKLAALGITGAALYDYYTKGRRWYPTVNRVRQIAAARKSAAAVKSVAAARERTFSRKFAKDQALQLGRLTYPSVIKRPMDYVGFFVPTGSTTVSDNWTTTVRFCPFGKSTSALGLGIPWKTCFESDKRFQTLCTLYSEFRLVSVTYRIALINGAGDTLEADTGAYTNDLSIFAKVIRNIGYSATPYTDFQSTADQVNCPGIIWARSPTTVRYPQLRITIKPSGTKERSQWFSTNNDGSSQMEWLANDTSLDFFPGVDVCFFSPRGFKNQDRLWFSCVMRAVVQFRSGRVPTTSSSKDAIKEATTEIAVRNSIVPGTNVQDVAHAVLGYEEMG